MAHPPHIWHTSEDVARMLQAQKSATGWRAICPAHAGHNRTSLSITEGRDREGNPMTLLHCFAQECSIEAICEALSIHISQLFAIQPAYAKATRNAPRAKSPGIARLKQQPVPATPDEIAQIMLEEMIVSDPAFIQECVPARAKMWALAQASPRAREALTRALQAAHLPSVQVWAQLADEHRSVPHGVDK